MNSGIYCILNITNCKLYIGSSVNLSARFSKHISNLRKGRHHNQHLQKSFNKYGEENFVFVILQIIENKKEIIAIEQSYIELFSSDVLYNINVNATSNLGLKHKKAIKNSQKLYQFTINGELIKCWNSIDEAAIALNLQYKNIMRMCSKRKMTVNGVSYLSKSVGGYAWSYEKDFTCEKYNNNKKVQQYTLDNVLIKEYENIASASEETKCGHISDVCKGKRKSSGGFIWKYVK